MCVCVSGCGVCVCVGGPVIIAGGLQKAGITGWGEEREREAVCKAGLARPFIQPPRKGGNLTPTHDAYSPVVRPTERERITEVCVCAFRGSSCVTPSPGGPGRAWGPTCWRS